MNDREEGILLGSCSVKYAANQGDSLIEQRCSVKLENMRLVKEKKLS